jgi:hypothetical protein
VGATALAALLDSGSTHNFIDVDATRHASVHLHGRASLRVAVANDDRLTCPGSYVDLPITIGPEDFTIDCYGVSLGSYDMVLGIQWLESLGPILWDFARHTMGFICNGRRIFWTVVPTALELAILLPPTIDLLEDLLLQFEPLFETPTGLPPERERSHHIRLLLGTTPVAVQPYRYAHFQKQELEWQCADMLRTGVIRPSSSAFLRRLPGAEHRHREG